MDPKAIERAKELLKEQTVRHPDAAKVLAAGGVPEVEFPLDAADAELFGWPLTDETGLPKAHRMNTAWLHREVSQAEQAAKVKAAQAAHAAAEKPKAVAKGKKGEPEFDKLEG